jgi:hypothetical protein
MVEKLSKVVMVVTVIVVVTAVVLFLGRGCQQTVARSFGGTMTVQVDAGQKLVNATWKGDSLWILTRPMEPGEKPTSYVFKEDSAFGVMQGAVKLVESEKQAEK